jgi:hypothetical protein
MADSRELQSGVTGRPPRGVVFNRLSEALASGNQTELNREALASLIAEAYEAGVIAMAEAARVHRVPEARERLLLQAGLAEIALQITDDNPLEELSLNSVPSFATPPDNLVNDHDFDAEHRAGTAQSTEMIINNFGHYSDEERQKIATEMALTYAGRLRSQGVAGRELLQQTLAFEKKQIEIISNSMESGRLMQPDQDYHTFLHYQQDIFHAMFWVNDELRRRDRH